MMVFVVMVVKAAMVVAAEMAEMLMVALAMLDRLVLVEPAELVATDTSVEPAEMAVAVVTKEKPITIQDITLLAELVELAEPVRFKTVKQGQQAPMVEITEANI